MEDDSTVQFEIEGHQDEFPSEGDDGTDSEDEQSPLDYSHAQSGEHSGELLQRFGPLLKVVCKVHDTKPSYDIGTIGQRRQVKRSNMPRRSGETNARLSFKQ